MSAKNRTGQGSGGMNFLLGQPSGILHSLPDVFFLQVRIALQNLLEGGPMSDLSDDHGHRNPHPANAGSPPRIAGSNVIRSNIHLPPTVSNASSIIICCTPKQQQGTDHTTARRPSCTPLLFDFPEPLHVFRTFFEDDGALALNLLPNDLDDIRVRQGRNVAGIHVIRDRGEHAAHDLA